METKGNKEGRKLHKELYLQCLAGPRNRCLHHCWGHLLLEDVGDILGENLGGGVPGLHPAAPPLPQNGLARAVDVSCISQDEQAWSAGVRGCKSEGTGVECRCRAQA